MPTAEYAATYYKKFGVKAYHDHEFYGQSTSIYIIDMGLTNTEESLRNVKTRTLINPMGRRNTHGSFVASIIGKMGSYTAAESSVPGIAPDAQIYLADVSDSQGAIYTSTLIKAIQDAIDLRVDIISISLGTNVYDQKLENVVNDAAKKGILVFAAAGNCNCRTYEFPAACESAISVASMDTNRRLSVFNTRNDAVAVFAPGQNIKVPGSSRLSGTSFAVPFASGLAALELSRRRAINPTAVMSRQEAITFLREVLDLDCSVHTYSTDVCSEKYAGGSFAANTEEQKAKLFLSCCLALFCVFVILDKFKK